MSRRKISRRSGSHHPLRPWVLSGLLALALALFLGSQAYAQIQQANDEAAIKQIALKASGASLQAVVVPNTRADSTNAITALAVPQADLSVAQTQAHALFNSVYDPTCVPCQTAASKTYQTLQSEGQGKFRALAWGF